ncbi:hypothetical protein BSKO_07538 [Bryopsis sp. KO-2023]|nr:hypothetical protein BSKO_07538 [Bryopsis sp. KO-2023]
MKEASSSKAPSCEPEQHSDERPSEAKQYWSIYTLQYLNPAIEMDYLDRCGNAWIQSDRSMHLFSMVPGILLLKTYRDILPLPLLGFWAWISIIACPLFAWLVTAKPGVYHRYRLLVVSLLRISMVLGMCFNQYDPIKEVTTLAVLGRILTKSPIAPLFVMAMNLRLPFKQHILVQLLSTGAAMVWVSNFCNSFASMDGFLDLFSVLGSAIDRMASLMVFNGGYELEDRTHCTCWAICAFVVAFSGSILPTLLLFSSEASSRARFLSSKYELCADEQNSLELCRRETMVCGLWGAVFFSIALWMLISSQIF